MRKFGRGKTVKVADLFQVYSKRFIAPERTVVVACIEVIGELVGIKLTKNEVHYSPYTRIVTITTKGPQRSEIHIHKSEILTHLQKQLGAKSSPKDIL